MYFLGTEHWPLLSFLVSIINKMYIQSSFTMCQELPSILTTSPMRQVILSSFYRQEAKIQKVSDLPKPTQLASG